MDGRTEFPRILQDIVSYWVRCPAYTLPQHYRSEQGKGTADLLMHLGDFFLALSRLRQAAFLFQASQI